MAAAAAPRGLVIAAPASGSGKTTLTLGLLRLLARSGMTVASAKVGPDYIDPAFHAAASGAPCVNLDGWAMSEATIQTLARAAARGADILVVEGVMGLFDGAADDTGSTACLAEMLGLPVILVLDAKAQAQSAAALLHGFASYRAGTRIAGVILNRVGSARHATMLRRAVAPLGIPVLGCVPTRANIALPSRHLGLVQAGEHADLEMFIESVAGLLERELEIETLLALAEPVRPPAISEPVRLPPPGQRVALARDAAFGFVYPHLLDAWRAAGAEITAFAPLADEAPAESADAVFLPGGYPELHGARLAANRRFLDGLRNAAARGVPLHGECGGFMALGRALTDLDGATHAMAGLLPVETSMQPRELTLGYREARLLGDATDSRVLRGHEFHYARIAAEDMAPNLYELSDAEGTALGRAGYRVERVTGGFPHAIEQVS